MTFDWRIAADLSPELDEVGPDEWRTEEGHHKFGNGCICRHGAPPDLCEESLVGSFNCFTDK